MELIIVRHGRPNRVEGVDGTADPSLTDVGLEQANAVADYLSDRNIDLIVSSPMLRARQTAQPLVEKLGMDLVIVDDLVEIDKDSDTYLPMEEVKAKGGDEWQAIVDDPDSMHGDVDIEAFADRVYRAFEQIIADNSGKTVVAFCHAMVTMCYLQRTLGYGDRYGLRIDYASITRIQASRAGVRSVRSVNETMHLGNKVIITP
mgnify:FL=1